MIDISDAFFILRIQYDDSNSMWRGRPRCHQYLGPSGYIFDIIIQIKPAWMDSPIFSLLKSLYLLWRHLLNRALAQV